ncbi:type III pantothenate kinase [Thiomicrospira sp. ALE5]|uniref:type III pantothenate kinase n=1 Tax=Thiomicrospira sp. ALE5 TaxID=748650 RepID=UPI0008E6B822|nr:type III pantothenate kinase [Thiomicrospira sp. ALE5]SFR61576.1 type III pantothenate kinase [Thiomicrospira sp. ALE5]
MNKARLLLDLGNTHLNWGLCESASLQIFDSGRVSNQAWSDLISATGEFVNAQVNIDDIWLCSVAKSTIMESLLSWLAIVDRPIYQATTGLTYNKLVNSYDTYSQLGVDRWLALIALVTEYGCPGLLVDAGSAMTLDYVDCDGVYQGGWIVPGISKSRQCLSLQTNLLVTDSTLPDTLTIAKNTSAGIDAGLLAAAIGTITQFEQQIPKYDDLQKVITGGEGSHVSEHLQRNWRYDQHLVLKGLALYAQDNIARDRYN